MPALALTSRGFPGNFRLAPTPRHGVVCRRPPRVCSQVGRDGGGASRRTPGDVPHAFPALRWLARRQRVPPPVASRRASPDADAAAATTATTAVAVTIVSAATAAVGRPPAARGDGHHG